MNSENTIAEFYRQIGRTFRQHGADRVVLLKSRTCQQNDEAADQMSGIDSGRTGMYLEVAVDGCFDLQELQKVCSEQWPDAEISILDLSAEENLNLIDEVLEDGILL